MKKLIKYLYNQYCLDARGAFFHEEKEYSEAELKQLFMECKLILDHGFLQKVVDMVYADSENTQLYKTSNKPIQITESELERYRRIGISDLMTKIRELANKLPKEEEATDIYSIT